MDNDRESIWRNSERGSERETPSASAASGRKLKTAALIPLVLSYIVELIFTLWELDKRVLKDYFIFFSGWVYENGDRWDGRVSDCSFVYGFMETSARGLIFVSAAIASWYGVKMNIFFVCITLEIIDGFDYWLFYNHTWFNTGIEFNYIKIGIIFYCAWREYTR